MKKLLALALTLALLFSALPGCGEEAEATLEDFDLIFEGNMTGKIYSKKDGDACLVLYPAYQETGNSMIVLFALWSGYELDLTDFFNGMDSRNTEAVFKYFDMVEEITSSFFFRNFSICDISRLSIGEEYVGGKKALNVIEEYQYQKKGEEDEDTKLTRVTQTTIVSLPSGAGTYYFFAAALSREEIETWITPILNNVISWH